MVWRSPTYPIVKVAVALLLWPWYVQVTVPVPPLPFDSICHDQPTLPLPPTVCKDPLNAPVVCRLNAGHLPCTLHRAS
jgi:hypothetical protein